MIDKTITFDPFLLVEMLKLLDFCIGKDGMIHHKNSSEHATATDGKQIKATEVAGFIKWKDGKIHLIRNNIVNLIEVSDYLEGRK